MVKKMRPSTLHFLTPKASQCRAIPRILRNLNRLSIPIGFSPNPNLKISNLFFIYGTKTKFCIWNEPSDLLALVTTTKMDIKMSTELVF